MSQILVVTLFCCRIKSRNLKSREFSNVHYTLYIMTWIYNSPQHLPCAVLWSPVILDNYNCEHIGFVWQLHSGFLGWVHRLFPLLFNSKACMWRSHSIVTAMAQKTQNKQTTQRRLLEKNLNNAEKTNRFLEICHHFPVISAFNSLLSPPSLVLHSSGSTPL